jgi:ubiquinone/menaquinone biosynthesis C-methylase UbiE
MLRAGRLRTEGQDVEWIRAVAEALPIAAGALDAAVLFTTIEFVDEPGAALAEAQRVLRPGGLLVVGFLDALSPWAARYRREADRGEEPWNAAHFFTLADLQPLVGSEPETVESAVFRAPDARPPFDGADEAGRRAGNRGSLTLARWRKR